MSAGMTRFDFDVAFAAPASRVFDAFWELADWTTVAPHVKAIELHYQDPDVQVLTMRVETRGRLDGFRSVRVRQGDSIFFVQPRPPALLRRHWGWWHVRGNGAAASVRSEHWIEPEPAAAARFLRETGDAPASAEEVERQLVDLIRNNSLQTMLALKSRLEGASGPRREPIATEDREP
jgi:hypothetical protein